MHRCCRESAHQRWTCLFSLKSWSEVPRQSICPSPVSITIFSHPAVRSVREFFVLSQLTRPSYNWSIIMTAMIPQYGGHTDRCGLRFKDFRKEALYILSREQCCIKSCFLSRTSSFDKAITIISEARMEIHNIDRGAKKDHIRDLVTNCIKGDSVKNAPMMI